MAIVTNLALGDIVECVVSTHCNSQAGLNVTHWEITSLTGTGVSLEALGLRLGDDLDSLYAAIMHTSATFRGVHVTRIFPLPRSYQVPLEGTVLAGTAVGNLLPTQVRGILVRSNGLAGPRNRSRLFLPFPASTFLFSDGGVDASYIPLADAIGAYYTSAITVGTAPNQCVATPRLLTRTSVPLSAGLHTAISYKTDNEWGTQKSSGAFGRPNA